MTAKKSNLDHPTYAVHPAVDHAKKVLASIPERTGKSLDAWMKIVRKDGPETAKEQRQWLRAEHGLGMPTAMFIVGQISGEEGHWLSEKAYLTAAPVHVDGMYSAKRAHLRPFHDAVMSHALQLGDDVKVCPCKTMVPIYRNRVFAQIKPATNGRVDVGLALGDYSKKVIKRLLDTGGAKKGDRITHRFAIEALADVDATVQKWLQIAYELDAA